MAYVPPPGEKDLEKVVRSIRNAHEIMGSAASTFGTDNRIVRTDGTERGLQGSPASMDDSGNITGTPSIAVNHVQFPATQVASADANALDDYEEGTWTPALAFGGGTTGITYSVQVGVYTKIGNLVHVYGRIVLTSKGSSTGDATITGLPFTSRNLSNLLPIGFQYFTGAGAGVVAPFGIVVNNSTSIILQNLAAGTASAITNTDFNNTTATIANMFYWV